MMKKYLQKTFILLFGSVILLPSIVLAQGRSVNTELGPNVNNLGQFIDLLFNKWGIPITAGIAVIMFMYAGYLYMTSQGDSGKIGEAKEIIIGVIVGVMLLFTVGILMRNVIGTLSGTGSSTTTVATAVQIKGSATSNLQKAAEALKKSTVPANQTASSQIQAILDKLNQGTLNDTDAAKQIQTISEQLKKNGSSDIQSIVGSIATGGQVLQANTILQQLESAKPEKARALGEKLQKVGREVSIFSNSDFAKDLQRIGLQIQAGADLANLIEDLKGVLTKANTQASTNIPTDTTGGYDYTKPNFHEPSSTPTSSTDYDYTKPNFHEPTPTPSTNDYSNNPAGTMQDSANLE